MREIAWVGTGCEASYRSLVYDASRAAIHGVSLTKTSSLSAPPTLRLWFYEVPSFELGAVPSCRRYCGELEDSLLWRRICILGFWIGARGEPITEVISLESEAPCGQSPTAKQDQINCGMSLEDKAP